MTISEIDRMLRGNEKSQTGDRSSPGHLFPSPPAPPAAYSSLLLRTLENSTLPLLLLPQPNNNNINNNVTDSQPHVASQPGGAAGDGVEGEQGKRWAVLGLLAVIVCSVVGNVLVCLAVCWERRLQNMTNYFLMSLAIADLLVSVVVMPLGMVVELFGYFPLQSEVCVVWVSSDVLMCTASIWHMCTMSMDRYFTLKYPMRYGRNKTKTMVMMKIFFVWVVSMAISSPICIHGIVDPSIVYNDGVCVPVLKDFVIYGSVFAFYIPLLIMIVTYVLTLHILWKNQRHMQSIHQADLRPALVKMPAANFPGGLAASLPHGHASKGTRRLEADEVQSDSENLSVTRTSEGRVDILLRVPSLALPATTGTDTSNACLLVPPTLSPLPLAHSSLQSSSILRLSTPVESPESPPEPSLGATRHGRACADTDCEDEDDEEAVDNPGTCLLQDKSMSYKSLSARAAMTNSAEEFFTRACPRQGEAYSRLSPSEKSGSLRGERRGKYQLDVPSPGQVTYRRGCRTSTALYSTASDTQLPSCSSSTYNPNAITYTSTTRPAFHHSCGGGLQTDYKSSEWDRCFFQIQQEMDACLQDGGSGGGGGGSGQQVCQDWGTGAGGLMMERDFAQSVPSFPPVASSTTLNNEDSSAVSGYTRHHHRHTMPSSTAAAVARQYRKNQRSKKLVRSTPNTPKRRRRRPNAKPDHTSDSDNEVDTSGSSASDVITIRLHPPHSPILKDSRPHSASEELTENSLLRSILVSSEADNTQDDSDMLNTNDESQANDSQEAVLKRRGKHKRLLKARFRNTLRASARPMFKHLLSKKTASNERKASKVLGIIFVVFFILWTPFFIVNILSVTCTHCMAGITSEMMSVFLWMGYVASLANPIIYTMFNTAFRRAFIHILTCRINRSRRMKFSDLPTFPSVTSTMPSERRGTMTILLDQRI